MANLISDINAGAVYKEKNFGPLANFFKQKTLLINNKFLARFQDDSSPQKADLYEIIGYIPKIEHHHFKSVSLPTNYQFGSESHFMNSFATITELLPAEDITVVLEEDQYGTVAKFINWCQRKLVTVSGVMRPRSLYTISSLTVDISNLQDRAVAQYIYKNIYFQSSDTLTMSYDGGEAIQYSITFKCTDISFIPLVGPAGNIFMSGNPTWNDAENPLCNLPNA